MNKCPWKHNIGYSCELISGHEGLHAATDLDGKSAVGWSSDQKGAYQNFSDNEEISKVELIAQEQPIPYTVTKKWTVRTKTAAPHLGIKAPNVTERVFSFYAETEACAIQVLIAFLCSEGLPVCPPFDVKPAGEWDYKIGDVINDENWTTYLQDGRIAPGA